MKITTWFGRALSLVIVSSVALAFVPGCGGASGEDVCEKANKLCPATTESDPDSGITATVTLKCDPNEAEKATNLDEISDCLDDAKDCNGAVACMAKAKR